MSLLIQFAVGESEVSSQFAAGESELTLRIMKEQRTITRKEL